MKTYFYLPEENLYRSPYEYDLIFPELHDPKETYFSPYVFWAFPDFFTLDLSLQMFDFDIYLSHFLEEETYDI